MEDRKKHCPHCGMALPEDASFCPHCESVLIEKHPAAVPKPKRRRRITAAILLAAVLAAALTAVGFASRGKVIDAQGAELFYDAEGEKFRLVLCFEAQGGAPFFSQPEIVENARGDQLHGRTATSLLFVDDGIFFFRLPLCRFRPTDSFVYLFLIAVSQLFDVGFVLLL